MLQALRQLGLDNIKTFQYDINKIYEFVDNKQLDKGYSVRNIFEIRTDDLSLVGTAIDNAVYYGANIVEMIQFEVSNSSSYYLQALNLAVADAYEKANAIADNLKLQFSPYPRIIKENSSPQLPFRSINMREGSNAGRIHY